MFIYIYKTYNLYNIYENMHIKASERSIYLTILVNNELFFQINSSNQIRIYSTVSSSNFISAIFSKTKTRVKQLLFFLKQGMKNMSKTENQMIFVHNGTKDSAKQQGQQTFGQLPFYWTLAKEDKHIKAHDNIWYK